MYAVYSKNKSIERNYDDLISSLEKAEQKKLMTTLTKYPKGVPRDSRVENIGRIEKKGKFWQYYAPDGYRVVYSVYDKPLKQVLVLFAGDHEEAAIWLRSNAESK